MTCFLFVLFYIFLFLFSAFFEHHLNMLSVFCFHYLFYFSPSILGFPTFLTVTDFWLNSTLL